MNLGGQFSHNTIFYWTVILRGWKKHSGSRIITLMSSSPGERLCPSVAMRGKGGISVGSDRNEDQKGRRLYSFLGEKERRRKKDIIRWEKDREREREQVKPKGKAICRGKYFEDIFYYSERLMTLGKGVDRI